jgi:hypothetical protein
MQLFPDEDVGSHIGRFSPDPSMITGGHPDKIAANLAIFSGTRPELRLCNATWNRVSTPQYGY